MKEAQQTLFYMGVAVCFFLLVVYCMNLRNLWTFQTKEGFEGEAQAEDTAIDPLSKQLSEMVKKVVPELTDMRLCDSFTRVRNRFILSKQITLPDTSREMSEEDKKIGMNASPDTFHPPSPPTPTLTNPEAVSKVDKELQTAIPGGPLECPLPKMPSEKDSPAIWLTYVQSLPTNLGAASLFTAFYTRNYLRQEVEKIKSATTAIAEGFQEAQLCPPDLADTRRSEKVARKKRDAAEQCLTAEEIPLEKYVSTVQQRLALLVETKDKTLQKGYRIKLPTPNKPSASDEVKVKTQGGIYTNSIDKSLKELVDECIELEAKLEEFKKKAEDGTLEHPSVK
jgi:hypothetical protein